MNSEIPDLSIVRNDFFQHFDNYFSMLRGDIVNSDNVAPYHNGKQLVCLCDAYSFPHRWGGGRCDGYAVALHSWNNRNHCSICNCRSVDGCDVVRGIESPSECIAVIEIKEYNE